MPVDHTNRAPYTETMRLLVMVWIPFLMGTAATGQSPALEHTRSDSEIRSILIDRIDKGH